MLLSTEQILLLLERLKWEPVYEDDTIVVAKKRGIGYSLNNDIARLEAALSVMGQSRAMLDRPR